MAGYKVKFRHKSPKGKVLGELGPFKLKRDAVKQAQVMADSGTLTTGAIVTVEKVGGTRKKRANPKIKMSSVKPGDVVHSSWTSSPGSKMSILVERVEAFGPDFKASGRFVNGHAKSAAEIRKKGKPSQRAWTWGRQISKVIKPNRRKNTSSRIYKGHQIKGKRGKYTVEPYGYPFTTLKDAKAWLDRHVRDAYPKPKKANPKRRKHPEVKIQRRGYERKGYWMTTSTGKQVWVPPTYIAATEFEIEDQGRPGVRSFGAKSAGEGYRRNKSKRRPTKKEIEARRYDKPLITREGKLGGPGYTGKSVRQRHKILDQCVKNFSYRSCLGSLQVLLISTEMGKSARRVIEQDKKWLMKKYGGPGSFGNTRRN